MKFHKEKQKRKCKISILSGKTSHEKDSHRLIHYLNELSISLRVELFHDHDHWNA